MADQEKVFVNLSDGLVQVYDENTRPVRVAPWSRRDSGHEGTYEVHGAHYEQFTIGGKGPLFPRPEGAKPAPAAPDNGNAGDDDGGEGGTGGDGGGVQAPANLKEYNVMGAEEVIAATDDVSLLKKWAKADDRKGVKEAVEKRLAELEE